MQNRLSTPGIIKRLRCYIRERFNVSAPDVILDFVFEKGLLYISLRNIGSSPAYRVTVDFDKSIKGIEGEKDINMLPLFQDVEFLAPGREIRTFLDSGRSYFQGDNPTRISAEISFFNRCGARRQVTIKHNLEIYRNIGYTAAGN